MARNYKDRPDIAAEAAERLREAYEQQNTPTPIERSGYGGSVYDQQYFTEDELRQAAEMRAAAERGETDWDSAHNYVEAIRNRYGYSGGQNGSGYTKTGPGQQNYVSPYQSQIDELWNRINGRSFDYDYTLDPRWQAYKKQYTREGQRAMQDTLGQYAAMTGGMPSTAALSAAQQAQNYYGAQMSDKIPELYQAAYDMYLNDGNALRSDLSTLLGMEDAAYSRWASERDYDYNAWADQMNRQTEQETAAYNRQLALAQLAAGFGDYSGLSGLGITPNYDNVLAQALAEAGRTVPVGGGSSGGGGGSGSGGTGSGTGTDIETDEENNVWSGADAWYKTYGEDAMKNYIKEHYRELGYKTQSEALAAWENHLLENGGTGSVKSGGSGQGESNAPANPISDGDFQSIFFNLNSAYSNGQLVYVQTTIENLWNGNRLSDSQKQLLRGWASANGIDLEED